MEENIVTWDGGDETTPPANTIIKFLELQPDRITPETEAEEI